MSVTVVIPSYKRAEYLKTAIESVKHQTAIKEIDRIIVSENSDDLRAKEVCDQFPGLNIHFVQQTGRWSAIEHVYWIIQQSNSTYTAMLHDDDWWYPTHLEDALQALKAEPDAASYFSNFIFAKNEINAGAFFHYPAMINYFTKNVALFEQVRLSFADVCSLSYLFTPFHMSSMVARTDFLKIANDEGLKFSRPWYADRILYPLLSMHGPVIFNPQVLVSIRVHLLNDAKTINKQERYLSHAEGSVKINELAKSRGFDILNRWQNILSTVSADEAQGIFDLFHEYFGPYSSSMFINQRADNAGKPASPLKKIIKGFLPYGLVSYLNRKK